MPKGSPRATRRSRQRGPGPSSPARSAAQAGRCRRPRAPPRARRAAVATRGPRRPGDPRTPASRRRRAGCDRWPDRRTGSSPPGPARTRPRTRTPAGRTRPASGARAGAARARPERPSKRPSRPDQGNRRAPSRWRPRAAPSRLRAALAPSAGDPASASLGRIEDSLSRRDGSLQSRLRRKEFNGARRPPIRLGLYLNAHETYHRSATPFLPPNVLGKSPQEYGRNGTQSFLIDEEKEDSRRGAFAIITVRVVGLTHELLRTPHRRTSQNSVMKLSEKSHELANLLAIRRLTAT